MTAAIVLAAGEGRRFGGRKLLYPLQGKPIILHTLEHIRKGGISHILVVTGAFADEVADAVAPYSVQVVYNPEYLRGQASSLAAGIRSLPPGTENAAVFLGDMPFIQPQTIKDLIKAHAQKKAVVTRPVFREKGGHPVIFQRALFPALAALTGQIGVRDFLRFKEIEMVSIPVEDPGVVQDIDYQTDVPAAFSDCGDVSM